MRKLQLNIIGKETLTLSSIDEIKEFYKIYIPNHYQEKYIAGIKIGQQPKDNNDYVKFYDDIFSIPLKGDIINKESVHYSEIKFNSDVDSPYLLINIYMEKK